MTSTPIQILESQLKSALVGTGITLPSSQVTEVKLTSFINNVIGSSNLTVTSIQIEIDGSGTLVVTGGVRLFSVDLDLTWSFTDSASDGITWDFKATTSDVATLSRVLSHYLSGVSGVPSSISGLGLSGIRIDAGFDSGSKLYSLAMSAVTRWGDLALDVRYVSGKWGAALGVELDSTVSPSQIWSSMAPLDALSLGNSAVVIADFTDPNLSIAGITGVHSGVELRSTLLLKPDDTGTSEIARIANELAGSLSDTEIDATVDIDTSQQDVQLTAMIPGPFGFPDYSALKLSSVGFTLQANPASASLDGTLDIPITIPGNPGVSKITVEGEISFTYSDGTGSVEATLSSDTRIVQPFNIRGFTLLDIGLGIDVSFGAETGAGFLFAGGFELGGNALDEQFALSIDFDDDLPNPSLLYLNSTKLSLPTIFSAVIDSSVNLPSALNDIAFSPLVLYWCDRAQTVPVGPLAGSACQPGVGFDAGLQLWGFDAYGALTINQGEGIKGQASIDPISLLDGRVKVTGNGTGGHGVRPGGAYFDFDTSSASFDGSLNADILGLCTQESADISGSALTIRMKDSYGFLSDSIDVSFSDSDHMAFSSALAVSIDASATIHVGGMNLGTIHIDDGLSGSLNCSVSGTTLKAQVDGTFDWNGHGFRFSDDLGGDLDDLGDLAGAIARRIGSEAASIFGAYFCDVDNYLSAVGKGLLTDGDFVLDVLAHAYNESIDDIFGLLERLPEGIHVDGDPDFHVDKGVGVPSKNVHADLGHIINLHADKHGDAKVIWHEDFKYYNIHGDLSASESFSTPSFEVTLLNIGAGGHFDLYMPPTVHADASSPHMDLSPHLDAGLAGGSVGIGGHVGVNAKVGVSNPSFQTRLSLSEHADAHADVLHLGAHGDKSAHQDTTI